MALQGDVIEITIRDFTMRKTGRWKFDVANKKLADGILSHIIRTYGFTPKISKPKNIQDWMDLDFDL